MRTAIKLFILLSAICLVAGCRRDPKVQRDKSFASAEKYLKENKFEEASIEYRNALRADPGHVPSYLGIAKAFQGTGDFPNAIGALQQVVKLDSKNVEARLKLGEFMLLAGTANAEVFKRAQQMAEEAHRTEPNNVDVLVLLGNACSGQNDLDNAVKNYEKALAIDPVNLKATLNLGAVLLRKGDLVKAESLFKQAIEKHPKMTQPYIAASGFYAATRNLNESEAYLKKAFDIAPDDPNCLALLSGLYMSQKKPVEAENILKEAMSRKPGSREPQWALANFYLQQSAADKGFGVLEEMVKKFPGDSQARLRIAEIQIDRKNEAKAEEQVQAVLKTNKNDGEAHFLQGKILRRRQELDKALAEFETAIKLNAMLAPAYLEKANLLLMRGDLDNCQSTLEAVLARNKNFLPARGALAKLLAIRQRPQDAMQQAQDVLAVMPNNEDAIGARAEAFRLMRKYDESKKDYLKLCEIQPLNAEYWHRLGSVEYLLGDSKSALAHFNKTIEISPNFIPAVNDLVLVHLNAKQFDTAIAELNRIAKMPGASQDETHRILGQVYFQKGDLSSAEREFRKTVELNPKNYQAYVLLGQLNLQRNNVPQALKEVDQLIAQNGKLAGAYFLKGYYLQVGKDIPGAMANYQKTLELEPENVAAANNLAWLLCESNTNLEKALTLAKAAKKKAADDPEIADTLGWVYYKMKNYTLAVDQLLVSVNGRKQPGAEHYYRLGVAYFGKGDLDHAKQTLRKSLELNASFPGADEARRILKLPG